MDESFEEATLKQKEESYPVEVPLTEKDREMIMGIVCKKEMPFMQKMFLCVGGQCELSEENLRHAMVESIVQAYSNNRDGLQSFLEVFAHDSGEARDMMDGVADVARHHDGLQQLMQSGTDDAGVCDTRNLRASMHRSYRSMAGIYRLMRQHQWRYVPLMNSSDAHMMHHYLYDDVHTARTIAQHLQIDGCGWEALKILFHSSAPDIQQSLLNHVRFLTRVGEKNIQMIDTHVDAVTVEGGLAGACTQSQGVKASWDDMKIGVCSNMEKTLKRVLGDTRFTDTHRHGRGFLVTQGSVPLGVIKAHGEASFVAARTVRDENGNVLLLRGMVYVVVAQTAVDPIYITDFGTALKDYAFIPKRKMAFLRSMISMNSSVVPERSIDLKVVQNCLATKELALFFKPMRMAKDVKIYRALHKVIHRAEKKVPQEVSVSNLREALSVLDVVITDSTKTEEDDKIR